MSDNPRYEKVLDLYSRPDNPLFVAETGNRPAFAPFFFAALGHSAIGFSPFGIDFTGYSNAQLGESPIDDETLASFAADHKLVEPMDREMARFNFEGKLQDVTEEKGRPTQDSLVQ